MAYRGAYQVHRDESDVSRPLPRMPQLDDPLDCPGLSPHAAPRQGSFESSTTLPPSVFTHREMLIAPPSPATSISTNSADSPVITPASSRRPSIALSTASSRSNRVSATGVSRTQRSSGRPTMDTTSRSAKRSASPSDASHNESAKADKEKKDRKILRLIGQDGEDVTSVEVQWQASKKQSTGNGTSSGLRFDKKISAQGQTALLRTLVEDKLKKALWQDAQRNDASFCCFQRARREMQDTIDAAIASGDPLTGSLLIEASVSNERCEREHKGRRCIVHGTDNYIDCRVARRERAFRANVTKLFDQYQRQL